MLILLIVLAMVNVGLIWSVFTIRAAVLSQTTIQTTLVRLLSKVAQNTGSDKAEINAVLDDLHKKL